MVLQHISRNFITSLVLCCPAVICILQSQWVLCYLNWHLTMLFCSLYFLFIPSLLGRFSSQLNLCSSMHIATSNSRLAQLYVMLSSSITFWVLHYSNVNGSKIHTQITQTLQSTLPVLWNKSSFSQVLLDLSKMLSDCARALLSPSESTCILGGATMILLDWTNRIVQFWSSWDLCADHQESSRAAETFSASL